MRKNFTHLLLFGLLVILTCGCSFRPTFPAATVKESVVEVCKKSSKIDAEAALTGGTIGARTTLDRLLNAEGTNITENARKVMGDVFVAVMRVALSTDADLPFLVTVVRGKEDLMEIQIIRYLADIKKADASLLGPEESMFRTVYKQSKITPEALESEFRVKEWTLEDFLAEQIVQRVRFAKDAGPEEEDKKNLFPTELIDGRYRRSESGSAFVFSIVSFQNNTPEANILKVLKVAGFVLPGYAYKDFDQLEIRDLLGKKILSVDRETVEMYGKKKLTEKEVMAIGLREDFSDANQLQNTFDSMGSGQQ